MGPWRNVHIRLETLGKGSQKLTFGGQANKGGHTAVGMVGVKATATVLSGSLT